MNHHQMNPLTTAKDTSYYEFSRPEVVNEIVRLGLPTDRILELGCSTGATASAIRQRVRCSYYEGLELSSEAANQAASRLNKVQVVNIEHSSLEALQLANASFDLLIGLDIFEHLYDPWETLAKFVQCLKPGGHFLCSIPNVQNITILDGLIKGNWTYESAGLLDATHVRFFTYNSVRDFVMGAGLDVLNCAIVFNPPADLDAIQETGNEFRLEKLTLTNLTRDDVIRLFAYQFIVVGRKR